MKHAISHTHMTSTYMFYPFSNPLIYTRMPGFYYQNKLKRACVLKSNETCLCPSYQNNRMPGFYYPAKTKLKLKRVTTQTETETDIIYYPAKTKLKLKQIS